MSMGLSDTCLGRLLAPSAFGVLFGALAGCGDPTVDCKLPVRVTYEHDIVFFLSRNCTRCHASNKRGPDRNAAPIGVNFDSYEGISARAARAAERVALGTMPPDAELDPCDAELFQNWLRQGILKN